MDTIPQQKEIYSPAKVFPGMRVSLIVPRTYTARRLYLFIDTKSTGDFVLFSAVKTLNYGLPVDYFRADLLQNTNATILLNQSVTSQFAVGGSAVGDSWVVQLQNPFNVNLPSIVAQPLRVDSEIDEVQWELEGFSGQLTGIRAWLGCISSIQK